MKKNYVAPELNKISFLPDESIMDNQVTIPGGGAGAGSEGSGFLPFDLDVGL